jgi:hypothetical protein
MICHKCNVELIIGQAIEFPESLGCCTGFGGEATPRNNETLEIIECWKCPKCGHSEDRLTPEVEQVIADALYQEFSHKIDQDITDEFVRQCEDGTRRVTQRNKAHD